MQPSARLLQLIQEFWLLTAQMAPYLLFGFGIAGILHVIFPRHIISRHLSGRGFLPVIKAALIGVPLPLCSCSVIPVSAHLKKAGASDGATLSFLASTPSTGVDSILATYGMLGPVFTFFRVLFAFSSGIIAGALASAFSPRPSTPEMREALEPLKTKIIPETQKPLSILQKTKEALRYGYIQLIRDMSRWILLGLFMGALITWGLPPSLFTTHLSSPFWSYLSMLLLGIPMYICATGSIPIASALIAKGMSPGAALVFLAVGPATNTATIAFIAGNMGKKNLAIYLITLSVVAILCGAAIDYSGFHFFSAQHLHIHAEAGISVYEQASAGLLLALMAYTSFKK